MESHTATLKSAHAASEENEKLNELAAEQKRRGLQLEDENGRLRREVQFTKENWYSRSKTSIHVARARSPDSGKRGNR